MKANPVPHYPELHSAVLEHLEPRDGEILLDCTMGRGGHAMLLDQHLGSTGRYIGLDCDDEAIQHFCNQDSAATPPTSLNSKGILTSQSPVSEQSQSISSKYFSCTPRR